MLSSTRYILTAAVIPVYWHPAGPLKDVSHPTCLPGTLFAEISHVVQGSPDAFADLFKRADMQRQGELPLLDVARVCSMLLPEGLVEVDSNYLQVSTLCSAARCEASAQSSQCGMLHFDASFPGPASFMKAGTSGTAGGSLQSKT